MSGGKLGPELHPQSQLVVLLLELRGLQQTADLGPTLVLRKLGISFLLLLLYQVELCVVAGELTERDEEVAERQPELVVLGVQREQTLSELFNLFSAGGFVSGPST